MVYMVSAEGEVILPPTKYPHTKTAFAEILSCLEKVNSTDIHIIMESTSGYHLPAERYLRDHTDYEIIIINPLISNANKHNLRRTKTDSLDCLNLENIFFHKDYNFQNTHEDIFIET